MRQSIAVIGCGHLGESIVQGLLQSGKNMQMIATRRNVSAISHLADRGVEVMSDNEEAVRRSDLILLAVKPYNIDAILEEIKHEINPAKHVLVSVATGVTIQHMRDILESSVPIFRAMPNTATHVSESVTCLCGDHEHPEKLGGVQAVFGHIGKTIVIDESLMESATILGACGIAYALRFIRAMIQGGIQIGFSAEVATTIASQTVKGAAELLVERQTHPEHEIDKVTTPKGCTIVGLNEMEHSGFSSSLIKGIVASYDRIAQD